MCRRSQRISSSLLDQHLLPSFILVTWVSGLCIGQWTGSLTGCVIVGFIAVLTAAAFVVWWQDKPRATSTDGEKWTILDWAAFVFIALAFLRIYGNDTLCHYSVVHTVVRGNIPPSSLNDPNFPLIYHSAFNLGAAVIAKSFAVNAETACDLMSILCVYAVIAALQRLSRIFFSTPLSQQCSRLLFLFGLGPTYFGLIRPPGEYWFEDGAVRVIANTVQLRFLHGQTVQSYAEAIFRRPTALNFVILLAVLAILLLSQKEKIPTKMGRLEFYLLPFAILLPLASEELTALFLAGMLFMVVRGYIPFRSCIYLVLAIAIVLPFSGVAHGLTGNSPAPAAVPDPVFSWRFSFPKWPIYTPSDHVPLFSVAAIALIFREWGPIFLIGLLAPVVTRRARDLVLVILILLSFIPALVFDMKTWGKSDLDRFLFYGTALGFFLSARVLEWFELKNARTPIAARFLMAGLLLFGTSSSVGYLFTRMDGAENAETFSRNQLKWVYLQDVLSVVGPKDLIRTDRDMAQHLVLAGFLVDAPMPSASIGYISMQDFDKHQKTNKKRIDWFFLRMEDPRVAGKAPVILHKGYALVRASSS